jgi:hypothetical protein
MVLENTSNRCYSFKYYWGWTQKASETCTVILQLLINILLSCITLVLYIYFKFLRPVCRMHRNSRVSVYPDIVGRLVRNVAKLLSVHTTSQLRIYFRNNHILYGWQKTENLQSLNFDISIKPHNSLVPYLSQVQNNSDYKKPPSALDYKSL